MADWVYGRNPVLEALRSGEGPEELLIQEEARPAGPLAELLRLAGSREVPVRPAPRAELDRLARSAGGTGVHQGVVARLPDFRYVSLDEILASPVETAPLVVILDCLQDVQNLGSLIRTAEAVGASGVVLPERRAAGVTAAVRRASAGAVEHLRISQVGNLARALETLKEAGLWTFGLAADAPTPCWEADLTGPAALVVGGEGAGLRRLVRERCDVLLRIPMRGRVASLNTAVAGSIVLYEALRQRGGR